MLGSILYASDLGEYSYPETGYMNPHAVGEIANGLATTTYAYDANGNLISANSTTYGWNYQNRLASSTISGTKTFYHYDPWGMRTLKGDGTSATTTYPNKWYNASSATTTKHVYTPDGELIATILGTGANATTTYVHTDHLGGTNAISDEDSRTVELADFFPYGASRISEQYGTPAEQKKFIGQEYDEESGLNYFLNRYYQSQRGQFISQDPLFWSRLNLSNPQSQNSYSYAENNPINKKDPTGLISEQAQATIQAEIKKSQQQFYNRLYAMGEKAGSAYLNTMNAFLDPVAGYRALTNTSLSTSDRSQYSPPLGARVSAKEGYGKPLVSHTRMDAWASSAATIQHTIPTTTSSFRSSTAKLC